MSLTWNVTVWAPAGEVAVGDEPPQPDNNTAANTGKPNCRIVACITLSYLVRNITRCRPSLYASGKSIS